MLENVLKIRLLFLLSALILTGCEADLKVKVAGDGVNNICIQNPDHKSCQTINEVSTPGSIHVLKPGAEFIVDGTTSGDGTVVMIDGRKIESYTKADGVVAVRIPDDIGTKKLDFMVIKGNMVRKLDNIFALDANRCPLITIAQDLVCSDQIYCDESGHKVTGTRDCSKATDDPNLKPENIKVGVSIAGVKNSC